MRTLGQAWQVWREWAGLGAFCVVLAAVGAVMLSGGGQVRAEIIPASGGGGTSATPTPDSSKANVTLNNLSSTAINTDLITGAGTALNLTALAPAQITTAQAGTAATVTASGAVAGSSVAGAAAGGGVTITAGAAARLTSGNANGGDIFAVSGAGIGTGTSGGFVVRVPTFSTSVSTGVPLTVECAGDTGATVHCLDIAGKASGTRVGLGNDQGNLTFYGNGANAQAIFGNNSFGIGSGYVFHWFNGADIATGSAYDLHLRRRGAANLGLGDVDAASPVAQKITAQGSRAGTDTNTSGADLTIQSGIGTGSATGSVLHLQTPAVGSTGTAAQTMADRVSLDSTGVHFMSVVFANLGTPADGTMVYCSDCKVTSAFVNNACTSSGSGSFAFRQAGAWSCIE